MMKKMLMVAIMSAVSATAFASDDARAAAKQVIELKDGSTVYIFKDGKMGMEDKLGRATRMKKDTVMCWRAFKSTQLCALNDYSGTLAA